MAFRTLYGAMMVLATVCAGCQEPAYAPTKQSQPVTDPLHETTLDSPTEQTPTATPQGDPSQAEQDAQRGLGVDVDVNVGDGGIGVDVGENGVNVDVGRDGVNVDVGDNGVGVEVGHNGVEVDVEKGEIGVDVDEPKKSPSKEE